MVSSRVDQASLGSGVSGTEPTSTFDTPADGTFTTSWYCPTAVGFGWFFEIQRSTLTFLVGALMPSVANTGLTISVLPLMPDTCRENVPCVVGVNTQVSVPCADVHPDRSSKPNSAARDGGGGMRPGRFS